MTARIFQPVPEYEGTHQFVINRHRIMCISSRQLPVDRVLDGWVFSISVHSDDLAKAWRLIEKTLLTWNGGMSGIEIPDLKNDLHPGHFVFGNQITLFTFKDQSGELLQSPKEIFGIMRRAENHLREASIKPGVPTPADRQITGSQYVSMRNDRDLAKELLNYVGATQSSQSLTRDKVLVSPPPCPPPIDECDAAPLVRRTRKIYVPTPSIEIVNNNVDDNRAEENFNAYPLSPEQKTNYLTWSYQSHFGTTQNESKTNNMTVNEFNEEEHGLLSDEVFSFSSRNIRR